MLMHETSGGHSRQPTLVELTLRCLTDTLSIHLLAELMHETSGGHSRQPTLVELTLRYLTDTLSVASKPDAHA